MSVRGTAAMASSNGGHGTLKNKAEWISLAVTAVFLMGTVLYSINRNRVEGTVLLSAPTTPPTAAVSDRPAENATSTVTGRLDLNTSTAEELTELPGIGDVLAARIVDYRNRYGPFSTLEDLLDVPGIGESTLDKIYEYMDSST